MVEQVLTRFLGRIEQIPPAYSAVKIDGKRAYDLARKDQAVELKPKVLVIDEIELLAFNAPSRTSTLPTDKPLPITTREELLPRTGMRNKAFLNSPSSPSESDSFPSITIRVVCSKGTYIRALARDIGLALGSGAHLTSLRRTRVGDVHVQDCLTMDSFPEWLTTLNS